MSNQVIEKSPETVRAANGWLDSAAHLSILEEHFGYTKEEIDQLHRKHTGNGLSRTTIWRFWKKKMDALPGISNIFIAEAGFTETGIAVRAMLRELAVRRASHAFLVGSTPENKAKLERQLDLAVDEVKALRSLIRNLSPASEGDTARALDLASVDYLEGQTQIHRGRLLSKEQREEKGRHFKAGWSLMTAVFNRLGHAIKSGARNAEVMDITLAVNAALNTFFLAWEIDELASDLSLSQANAVARNLANPLFLRAANASANLQNDPRVAFNAASAAGLAGQHRLASESLELAAKLDGFKGNILDWNPAWMLLRLSDSTALAEAIAILNRKGSIR